MKNGSESAPLVVVGGGAAGMVAAWRAGSLGARVILLERNAKLGIKLLISGGGKCNITHDGATEELLAQFRSNESRFLKHSLYQFTNVQLVRHINERGVETYVRDDGRIFPISGKAGDVVHALRRSMEQASTEIRLTTAVAELLCDSTGITGVRTDAGVVTTRHLVLATGGASYPKTGTTGDGFRWLRDLGHTIIPVRPALAPILLDPTPPKEWQGVALRGCCVNAEVAGTTVASARGDLLFTHKGISGPSVLEASRDVFTAFERGPRVDIALDLLPEQSSAELEGLFQKELASNGGRKLETLVELFVPQRLAPYVLTAANVDGSIKCHQLKKEERWAILETLKHWSIGQVKDVPLESGEVTAGGIDLHEVDPKTMKSRVISGLYVCGEVLDIAGPIGGYNLQAAFSTGYVAGESAAKDMGVQQ